jgi:large subunit ribosomal protein L21
MYAVIEDRNQQHRVSPGDRVAVAYRAEAEPGATLTFDRVCLVGGEQTRIGTPYVTGATVTATVLRSGKGPKLIVQKFRRRKGYRRRTGARARFTEILIDQVLG